MNENKIAIESLSMDLMRVSMGLHRKSYKMAKRFSDEALLRCNEIERKKLKPYFAKIIKEIESTLSNEPRERTAEDTLMYSVLCRNYVKIYA